MEYTVLSCNPTNRGTVTQLCDTQRPKLLSSFHVLRHTRPFSVRMTSVVGFPQETASQPVARMEFSYTSNSLAEGYTHNRLVIVD